MPDLEDEALKKKQKKEKKKEKKESRKKGNSEETEEEEGLGSKVLIFLVTIVIIAIWLAILALLIKADVGGFGSSVLYPILKDVPYLNKVLPEVEHDYEQPEDTQYAYDSLEDAIARIKELELQLTEAGNSSSTDAQTIADLQAQIAELQKYKEDQAAFEKEKEKFYEEVVFSDVAPDINEYKAYYESINPENAEVLYKQVVEQTTHNEEVEEYAKTYSAMKAKEAAAIFDTMTNDLDLVADILLHMDTDSRAAILGKMDPETAAKVTQILEPRN